MALRRFLALSLCTCVACDFVQPVQRRSSGGELSVTLDFSVAKFSDDIVSFSTRGYNGTIPGPVLRVKAGDTLNLWLHNKLSEQDNAERHMNTLRYPNNTNLHTHGLHVSAVGSADNIKVEILPKESHLYSIEIPSFHMGGTHWYHPHYHGNTALQVGGGAAGMLIVDDADGEVPGGVAAMEEVLLMLTHIDMPKLVGYQQETYFKQDDFTYFNSALWDIKCHIDDDDACETEDDDEGDSKGYGFDTVLVNGVREPELDLVAGVWYRWRIVFASVEE